GYMAYSIGDCKESGFHLIIPAITAQGDELKAFKGIDGLNLYLIALTRSDTGKTGVPQNGEKMIYRYVNIETGKPYEDNSKVEPLYLKMYIKRDNTNPNRGEIWFEKSQGFFDILKEHIPGASSSPKSFCLSLNIRDFNGPYILVIVPEYNSHNIAQNTKQTEDGKMEVDIPIIHYTYTIIINQADTLKGKYVYSSSTDDQEIKEELKNTKIDITRFVVDTLDSIYIKIKKDNSLPDTVREEFTKKIKEAENYKYQVSVGELIASTPYIRFVVLKDDSIHMRYQYSLPGSYYIGYNKLVKKNVYKKVLGKFNSDTGKYYPFYYSIESFANPVEIKSDGPFYYFKNGADKNLEFHSIKMSRSGNTISGSIKDLSMGNGGAMLAFSTYPVRYTEGGSLFTKETRGENRTYKNVFYTLFNETYIGKSENHDYTLYKGEDDLKPDPRGEVTIVHDQEMTKEKRVSTITITVTENTQTTPPKIRKITTPRTSTITHKFELQVLFGMTTSKVTHKLGVVLNNVKAYVNLGAKFIKIKYDPKIDIIAVPALAPVGGSGFPTTIFGTLEQLNIGSARNMESTLENIFGNPIYGLLMPNYLPTPLPVNGLNYVAPGEYVGAIIWINTTNLGYSLKNLEEDLGSGNGGGAVTGILSQLGVGVLSIMMESVKVSLVKLDNNGKPAGTQGDVEVIKFINPSVQSKFKLKVLDQPYVNLYSYGLGIGESNDKKIGPRIYLVPSSSTTTDIGAELEGAAENIGKYQAIAEEVQDNPVIQLFNSIVAEKSENEKGETPDFGSSVVNTAMGVIGGVIKGFLSKLEGIGQAVQYGVYPQLSCYLGGQGTLWPYFLVSPKNGYRFVPLETGDYMFQVSYSLTVVDIRVLKVGPIPIPLPVPRQFKGQLDKPMKDGKLTNVIHVMKIGVLPLYVSYETEPLQTNKNTELFSDIYRDPSNGLTVDIYAVPVWMKEGKNGENLPVSPVLLRGKYKDTGLSIVAATRGGLILDSSTVYFFGLPLKPIKLKLSTLEQLVDNGAGYINLSAVWHVGNFMAMNSKSFAISSIKIEPTKSFVLLGNGSHVLLYTGVYDPGNKLHTELESLNEKYGSFKDTIDDEVLNPVRDGLENVRSKLSIIYNINNIIEEYRMEVQKELNDMNNHIGALIEDTVNYVIMQITHEVIRELIHIVVYVVLPLPIDILKSVETFAYDQINNFLKQYEKAGIENPFEMWSNFTLRYGELIVENYSLTLLSNMVNKVNGKDSVFNSIIKQGMDMVDQAIGYVDKAEEMLDIVGYTFQRASDISVYKPMLLAQAEIVTPSGTRMADGFLSSLGMHNAVLAMDMVETDSVHGAVIYVYPYSTYSFAVSLLLGESNKPGSYVALGLSNTLRYLAAWLNFARTIYHAVKDNSGNSGNTALYCPNEESSSGNQVEYSDKFQHIYCTLLKISDTLDKVQENINEYVSIPGLSVNEIILPSATQIPPTKI
ncbi:MAG: hypothetical protein GSR82_06055, partial [Desulfurococcales archaeon]|nr:hypothetical protein [Desulfurococcales archaeon]